MESNDFESKWGALEKTREEEINEALVHLSKHTKYSFTKFLGKGSYGDVVEIMNGISFGKKAAKIITPKFIVQNEVDIWPKLNHANILPVEKVLVTSRRTYLMIMPLAYKSWYQCVESEQFRQCSSAIMWNKRWTCDVLKAVLYMHTNLWCHLDIKLDNVMISFNGSAMLCDFTAINSIQKEIKPGCAPLPRKFRPPESFGESLINGKSFDIWACGILSMQAFTGCALSYIKEVENFSSSVYPVLSRIFQKHIFLALVTRTYTSCTPDEDWSSEALSFLELLVQIDQSKRKPLSEVLLHKFLTGTENFIPDLKTIFKDDADLENLAYQIDFKTQSSNAMVHLNIKNDFENPMNNEIKVKSQDKNDQAFQEERSVLHLAKKISENQQDFEDKFIVEENNEQEQPKLQKAVKKVIHNSNFHYHFNDTKWDNRFQYGEIVNNCENLSIQAVAVEKCNIQSKAMQDEEILCHRKKKRNIIHWMRKKWRKTQTFFGNLKKTS